jgi:hypothetical protein
LVESVWEIESIASFPHEPRTWGLAAIVNSLSNWCRSVAHCATAPQLACRSQRHPCRRHRCMLGSRIWLSFRTRRRGLEHLQLAPLSFSLACGCALPSSLFSPAPVSPCASRTRHGLTTRHFSHWPRRTRIITIGLFPPWGATGDVGSARGRKRGGIEVVMWGSVSAHRSPVIVLMHVVLPDDAAFSWLDPSHTPSPSLPVPIQCS